MMTKRFIKKISIGLGIAAVIFILTSSVTLAAETPTTNTNGPVNYTPLVPLSEGNITIRNDNVYNLFIDLFRYAIAISAVIAIFMIILGGIQYMSTDAITGKRNGRTRIEQALLGLLLVILCYLILNTINPQIVQLNFFQDLNKSSQNSPSSNPPQETYQAVIFRNDIKGSPEGVFSGFGNSSYTSANQCAQNAPSAEGINTHYCVAVFKHDTSSTYDNLQEINCAQETETQCKDQVKTFYSTGAGAVRCVAVFNPDGTLYTKTANGVPAPATGIDCTKTTLASCQQYAIPYWAAHGKSTKGTIHYSDRTFEADGCNIQQETLNGTETLTDGEKRVFQPNSECIPQYTLGGILPNDQKVGSCMSQTEINNYEGQAS